MRERTGSDDLVFETSSSVQEDLDPYRSRAGSAAWPAGGIGKVLTSRPDFHAVIVWF